MFEHETRPQAINITTGDVLHDLACVRCGYNLRGLATVGVCPECGGPVTLTTSEAGLRNSSPEWRRRVGRGLGLVQYSLGAILLYPLLVIGVFFMEGVARRSSSLPIAEFALNGSFVVGGAASIVGCVGLIWLTSPEPAEVSDQKRNRNRPRQRTRATSVAITAVALLLFFMRMAAGSLFIIAETVLWICGACLLGVLGFNFSRWLVTMYRRAKPGMIGWVRTASALTFTFTVCLGVYAICLGIVRFRGYNPLLSTVVGCSLVLLLVLGLTSLGLLILLIRTLRLELRDILRVSAADLLEKRNDTARNRT